MVWCKKKDAVCVTVGIYRWHFHSSMRFTLFVSANVRGPPIAWCTFDWWNMNQRFWKQIKRECGWYRGDTLDLDYQKWWIQMQMVFWWLLCICIHIKDFYEWLFICGNVYKQIVDRLRGTWNKYLIEIDCSIWRKRRKSRYYTSRHAEICERGSIIKERDKYYVFIVRAINKAADEKKKKKNIGRNSI